MADGFNAIGCSNHTEKQRADRDFYATDPKAIDILINECRDVWLSDQIWEPACGLGHLSERLLWYGKSVVSSDIVNRGYDGQYNVIDFLNTDVRVPGADIVTNPPFRYATEFVKTALDKVDFKHYVCMFLKIQFLESRKRKDFLQKNPPRYVYVLSSRISCAENGDFEAVQKSGGSTICYAWFVWQRGWHGQTTLKIVN